MTTIIKRGDLVTHDSPHGKILGLYPGAVFLVGIIRSAPTASKPNNVLVCGWSFIEGEDGCCWESFEHDVQTQ